MPRLTSRMNDVAFMPKQTSEGSSAFRRTATLSRASAMAWSTGAALRIAPAALNVVVDEVIM